MIIDSFNSMKTVEDEMTCVSQSYLVQIKEI